MVLVIPESTFMGLPARPGRSVKHGNKEVENEEINEMVGFTGARTYYFRRCKRSRWSIFGCIPDDLLFEILVRLPAEDVYFGARLVCRKWYHMTRTKIFIQRHLECASYGLLYMNSSTQPVFISAREDGKGTNTYTHSYKSRSSTIPIWRSCNGLVLEFHCFYEIVHYVVTNALTGHTFRLPPYPYIDCLDDSIVAYDATSMAYKVVARYWDSGSYVHNIFTLGVDKSWRIIHTNHLSEIGKCAPVNVPIMTEGFIHWHRLGTTKVVTLNLETEIIAETPPPVFTEGEAKILCLSTGMCLSLFILRKKLEWEVFEMKPETGEWRKLHDICLESQMVRIKRLGFNLKHDDVDIEPCGWLKYPEVLALRVQGVFIIFYNFITCEIHAEKLSINKSFELVALHKSSLVWSGGF